MNLHPEQLRDLHAVMLADGQWYEVQDPTLPAMSGNLSFLQRRGPNENPVMVNVGVSDIKAAAYFGLPDPAPTWEVREPLKRTKKS